MHLLARSVLRPSHRAFAALPLCARRLPASQVGHPLHRPHAPSRRLFHPQPPTPPPTKPASPPAPPADKSHENIYTLPNILTATRLVAAPVVGYLVLHGAHAPALALFVYAGATDWLDGWIARRWKLRTVAGSVMDPAADKGLMVILTVCLALREQLPRTSLFCGGRSRRRGFLTFCRVL